MKLLGEKHICPTFFDHWMEQISDFKLSTKLGVIYHDHMDIIEQATTKKMLRIHDLDLMKSVTLCAAMPTAAGTAGTVISR